MISEKEKRVLLDLLLLALLFCAFISGHWIGQRSKFESVVRFYDGYLNSSCICAVPIIYEEDRLSYGEETPGLPHDFFAHN